VTYREVNSRHRSGPGRDIFTVPYVFWRNGTSFAFVEIGTVPQGIGIGDVSDASA
jgi:hypothetical protein